MATKRSALLEVARRCGVSQSTVSRVLNKSKAGRFSCSAEVQDRIRKVAAELNYRPSMAARNLAMTRTRLVAVLGLREIWSDRVGPIEKAVGALAEALDRAGYEICLQFISHRHGPFDLPPLRVDGVVALGPRNMEDLQSLDGGPVPYISIDGVVGAHGNLVAPDDAGGTRLALKHLRDLGHRRIGYLDHPAIDADHVSVLTRRNFALAVCVKEFGLEMPSVGLPPLGSDTPWDAYYEPFVREAVVKGGATAVLAYSHHMAVSLLRTAHDLGLSVPRDFSLVCFNDEPIVRLTVPALTAVDIPAERMGKMAAELLVRHMNSEKPLPAERIVLKETLVVRESTRPLC